MPEHPLTKTESIDFILANVCHLHRTRARQLLEALGLYQGQPPLLFELWREEGLTQTDIAARLKITPATVTKMLQRMEKAGFVHRQPDPDDQRVSRVYLTEAGRSIKAEVECVWKTLESETFSGLSQDEQLLLRRLLIQLRQNLIHVTGEEPWK
jgi:MarR family transcriptional regulator, organic hydroperoxide resistance regulator